MMKLTNDNGNATASHGNDNEFKSGDKQVVIELLQVIYPK